VRQESDELVLAEFGGVPQVVEYHVTADPADVRLRGVRAELPGAARLADLLEQARFAGLPLACAARALHGTWAPRFGTTSLAVEPRSRRGAKPWPVGNGLVRLGRVTATLRARESHERPARWPLCILRPAASRPRSTPHSPRRALTTLHDYTQPPNAGVVSCAESVRRLQDSVSWAVRWGGLRLGMSCASAPGAAPAAAEWLRSGGSAPPAG
jgi:hypothetical protein